LSSIEIKKISITKLDTDAIVNAANEGLLEGGGVCGAIFREAGSIKLTKACNAIGGCKTGNAVITLGFNLPAKYVIHAVGPRWFDGKHNEPKLLYSAYKQSLLIAKENGLHSIGFPLISAGIFGYPLDGAWRKAIQACNDFICNNLDYDIKVIFAVLDDKILTAGEKIIKDIVVDEKVKDNETFPFITSAFDGIHFNNIKVRMCLHEALEINIGALVAIHLLKIFTLSWLGFFLAFLVTDTTG